MRQQLKLPHQMHNFPPQPTPFIGRDEEIAEIIRLLADSACRLLTLTGAGGIGKTRLAIQAAAGMLDDPGRPALPAPVGTEPRPVGRGGQVASLRGSGSRDQRFTDGVYFVPLQPVRSADFLASAVADALKFSLSGQEEPRVQLLNYLRDKEMLLVLDNFEHLLDGVDLLTDILKTALAVKLLVTSREVLNLQEEWLYPVQGLPFPEPSPSPHLDRRRVWEGVEAYSAVQLFVERARQVSRDFSPVEEGPDVIRICQLVEGMPLAIELAASWTKSLQCAVIAAEIQRTIDFLTTSLRNVPNRQRSMRAVFDQSWKLLTQKERDVFKRLSVFQSSFQREAAERVAGASLSTLSALVDKSLLRSEPGDRYQIHELLRQCAEENLRESAEIAARVHDLHCGYYADFLQGRAEDLEGGSQREAIEAIAADLENIRGAWQWAVQRASVEDIQKAAYAFYHFCDFQGRYQEGADAFEKAVQSLDDAEPDGQKGLTLALLLVLLGFHYIRLGQLEKAKAVLERSHTIFNDLDVPPPPGFGTDPLTGLGLLANVLGDYAKATELGEEARRLNEARADKQNLQIAFYILANAAFAQGQYEAAQHYARRAYALTQETNNRWMMAYILSDLGNVARAVGDYAQARQHYQASYAIKQELNDPEGMAAALNHLGKIAWLQEDYREAEKLHLESLAIYREISDQGGLATSLNGLGVTACALGEFPAARQRFCQALKITADIQFVPLTLSILIGFGELSLQTGQPDRGIELLALALHHPASDHEMKAKAQQLLTRYEAEFPPDVFAAATQRGQKKDLETVATALQAEVAPLEEHATTAQSADVVSPAGGPTSQADQPLVEPLTPRELEVLGLVAEGLTNQQIAKELVVSAGTVKWYTSQIYGKLLVSSRTQAVARARELRLLS